MTGRRSNTAVTFWQKVDMGGVDECWPWMGKTKNGYGRYSENREEFYSHRYAAISAQGGRPIPQGSQVMHSCNNKLCCNPRHLSIGSAQKNTQDAYRDGLISPRRGEAHPQAKLTVEQVISIRIDSRPLSAIAAEYGIGLMTASNIKNRKIWRHVP